MRTITLLLTLLTLFFGGLVTAQTLRVFDQDYAAARAYAQENGKLILVDFYTTWCGPCKELDRKVFSDPGVRAKLAENYVMLKYDAEKDTVHHLSKKLAIMSYPSATILTAEGYVLTDLLEFDWENDTTLIASVLNYTTNGTKLAAAGQRLPGYSNEINPEEYPAFYRDYVNRTNIKPDSAEYAAYWAADHDVFSEAYYSTMYYFSVNGVPAEVADNALNNRDKYAELFGEGTIATAIFFHAYGKLSKAAKAQDPAALAAAKAWTRKALAAEEAEELITGIEERMAKAGKS